MIKYKDKIFSKYISSEQISESIYGIAGLLNEKYKNKELHVIGVLNGSVPFMMDLLKLLDCSYTYDFMKISSYKGMKRDQIKLDLDVDKESLKGKDVLLIEDIVDSGNTIKYIKEHFKGFNIKSLSVLALFVRSQSKKQVDWFLYEIKNNKYIIGYGMDCNNLFRDLKDVYIENNE